MNSKQNFSKNIISDEILEFFPERKIPQPRQINFVVDTKIEEEQKVYLVELDINFEARVGDLLEANDSRTNRTYLIMVSDIGYAYPHKAEHAEMLDLLRRRSDKEVDDATFRSLCKNLAVCTLLGEIIKGEITERGYRPSKYTTTVVRANNETEKLMANEWQEGVLIGSLRVGRETRKNIPVNFSTSEFVGKRVLIVGQTGKGKSTLMRQLLDGHLKSMMSNQEKRKVGYLVDDFKMEYSFDITNQAGKTVPGLVTKLGKVAQEKLVILTCNPNLYSQHKDQVKDIVKLQIPLETLSLSVFCDLANLTEAQTNVVRLVEESRKATSAQFFEDILAVDEYGMPNILLWGQKYGPVFYSDKGKAKIKKGQEIETESDIDNNLRGRLHYIRRAVIRLLNMPFITKNKNSGDCTGKLLEYLKEGCTVIVDKNHLEDHQQEMLTVLLLYQLFRHNQKLASGKQEERAKMIPVVVAVEEAQYLLSKDKVADPESIFAKIAFTGRSYQIGLLAITQRPQAIQKELLGQFDGFFVLPLEHANDFRHLADACPILSSYRNDLASAPVGGAVLAYGSPKKVVSVQINDYTFL
ncbi:protein of unknown function DUF87 [Gloeothece citriformis PCC 7424]|uniref:Helicase HerA central domain-containing protein n=1 Tax=Gloeothece citriformis (strain PCC 7424) TaxID=65393 RepID=B7KDL2_GLOC7|nr:DUF87 domain-containing protein [Gloeothece citriformis]ACK70314.1 protein of unknown function DUF87 [Gloeothece citriformis PCC 7424]